MSHFEEARTLNPKSQIRDPKFQLLHRYIFQETPVAASADLYVADALVCNYEIRRVPKREEGQVVTHQFPRLDI